MIAKTLLEAAGGSSANYAGLASNAHIGSEYLSAAMVELTESLCDIDKQYMVADVIGSVKVLTEGADVEAVTEGIISTGIEKIKAAWKKLLAKIKEYYKKVVDFFKAMFLTGKKFVDEFGARLQDKAASANFKYSGYEYKKDAGDSLINKIVTSGTTTVKKLMNDFNGDLTTAQGLSKSELGKLVGTTNEDDLKLSESEYEDKFCSDNSGATNLEELVKKIGKTYRDGDIKSEGVSLSKSDATMMCEFISSSNKVIRTINDDQEALSGSINGIIKKLNSLGKDDEGYKAASIVSRYMTRIVTVMERSTAERVTIYREMVRNFTAVLKALYRFKPAKEGFDPSMDVEMEEGCDQTADEDLKDMEEALQIYLEGDCNEEDDDDDDKDDDDVEESFFAQAARYL